MYVKFLGHTAKGINILYRCHTHPGYETGISSLVEGTFSSSSKFLIRVDIMAKCYKYVRNNMIIYFGLVNRLSSSFYMVRMMNSSVRRGHVTVDLTEGEAVFLETVQATSTGGIAHVGSFALVLMGAELEQHCWGCTELPWRNPDKRVGAEEISQF